MCIFPSKMPALTQDKLFQEISSINLNDGSSENKLHILHDAPNFSVGNKSCSSSVCNRACTRTISWVFSNGPHSPDTWRLVLHSGAAVMFYSFTYLLGGGSISNYLLPCRIHSFIFFFLIKHRGVLWVWSIPSKILSQVSQYNFPGSVPLPVINWRLPAMGRQERSWGPSRHSENGLFFRFPSSCQWPLNKGPDHAAGKVAAVLLISHNTEISQVRKSYRGIVLQWIRRIEQERIKSFKRYWLYLGPNSYDEEREDIVHKGAHATVVFSLTFPTTSMMDDGRRAQSLDYVQLLCPSYHAPFPLPFDKAY